MQLSLSVITAFLHRKDLVYLIYFVHKWCDFFFLPEFTVKYMVFCKSMEKNGQAESVERERKMRMKEEGFAALRYSPLISF